MNIKFTFKPVEIKKPRISNNKKVSMLLYCVAKKDKNDNWIAKINTKGLENYNDTTILPFSEKSFDLRGKNNVWYRKLDRRGHVVRCVRSDVEAFMSPGNSKDYISLRENAVFTGHIVKHEGNLYFNIKDYVGPYNKCSNLLEKRMKKEIEEK